MKAGNQIVMAPSGVQKERMKPEDMFVLDGQTGYVTAVRHPLAGLDSSLLRTGHMHNTQ